MERDIGCLYPNPYCHEHEHEHDHKKQKREDGTLRKEWLWVVE